MSDYYDPRPRFSLERPIVIGGQLGCGARLIGRALCARTGLSFADVDRSIEHEVGASLLRLADQGGVAAIERSSTVALERIARRRPCGVIVLDRAWPTLASAGLLRDRLHLIHVRRSPDFLLEALTKQAATADRWLLEALAIRVDLTSQPLAPPDLAPLHARRAPLLEAARVRFDAGRQHALRVAEGLLDPIESIAGARAP
jgi:shikimate kinase